MAQTSIIAKSNGSAREPIPAGTHIARCYQMIQIGTVLEQFPGKPPRPVEKVRIGWEIPNERRVFSEEKGEQCFVVSKEYTLSMNEKSNLRKMLESWRGKGFSEDDAKAFDITKLIGVQCLLNIIHKEGKDGNHYPDIAGVMPLPKGMTCPPQENKTQILAYSNFDFSLYNTLPDFIKAKIAGSEEFIKVQQPNHQQTPAEINEPVDDLPF